MRSVASIGVILGGCLLLTGFRGKDYPVTPIPFDKVKVTDGFWSPRLDASRLVTLPHVNKECRAGGRLDNFAIAGGSLKGEQRGAYPFDDTDLYKYIEGASYSLRVNPDPALAKYLDTLIALIGAAQEPDGYLYTARTNLAKRLVDWAGEQRWSRLGRSHELYNAGHLYEAAVAHFQTTGKRTLLDIALRNAALVASVFGPGRKQSPPGHQEIEIGLVKLYRTTGEEKYLSLAGFFLDQRGRSLDGRKLWGEYAQDHAPILEQEEAVGHAVRETYMISAVADVAAMTGDAAYKEAAGRLWRTIVERKLYITGGLGSEGMGEGFGPPYDLPNMSAYCETCASVGNVLCSERLFLLHGDARYIDVLERTLYNALLSGISLEGDTFFYPNPLASRGQHVRTPWFECACCPTNLVRFFPTLPGYIYAIRGDELFVNLFVSNTATIEMGGHTVRLSQETLYPRDGKVRLTVNPDTERIFSLNFRVPGWANNSPVPGDLYRFAENDAVTIALRVNGRPAALSLKDGYAVVRRRWVPGDVVEVDLDMRIRRVVANDRVLENQGRVALQRGPLVYCAEWPDNKDGHVLNIVLPDSSGLQSEFRPDLLGGVELIRGRGLAVKYQLETKNRFSEGQDIVALPYYAWANRGPGEMNVWLARDEARAKPSSGPPIASRSRTSSSGGKGLEALNDRRLPANSADTSGGYFIWPSGSDTSWVQYDFDEIQEVSEVQVYWLDGPRNVHPPRSWRILALFKGVWEPVWTPQKTWGVEKNIFNRIVFETVRTRSLRLDAVVRPGAGGGIIEWQVF